MLSRAVTSAALRASRSLSSTAAAREIQKVGVIGLGLMGHGIVQESAANGFDVVALDQAQASVDSAMGHIDGSLSKVLSKKAAKTEGFDADAAHAEIMGRIQPTTDLNDMADCDLVIEAIVENIDIKTPLYQELGRICKPETILASNTSSLPIQAMADVSGRPERTVGLHFFNPVQLMKLVEVIGSNEASEALVNECVDYVKAIRKVPVVCTDTPGFVVNRLLVPYISSAIAMLDRGVAAKEDIDVAMQLGAGHPMGPIHLADYVGLDTSLSILEGWCASYPDDPAFFVPESLRELVAAGKLGRKSGEGYYKWDGNRKL